MDVSAISRLPAPSLGEAPTLPLAPEPAEPGTAFAGESPAAEPYQQCDECGAPVDKAQRYCVACGAHRRHVNDPAARYLSHATARSRTSRAAAAPGRTPRSGGRSRGLGTALSSRPSTRDLTITFAGLGLALLFGAALASLRWNGGLP